MNHFKITLNLFLAICLAICIPMTTVGSAVAQDTPAKSKKQDQDQDKKPPKSEKEKSSDDQETSDEKDSQDSEDEEPEKESDKESDKKPDDKESDKQSDKKKSTKKKADKDQDKDEEAKDDAENKDDEKKQDDDEEKDNKKETKARLPFANGLFGGSSKRISSFSKKSAGFVSVFDEVVSSVNDSTLRIMDRNRQIALGTIVGKDGLILTKASQLKGELVCKLPNGKSYDAKVIGIDPETDLALLKIEVDDLTPVDWSEEDTPNTGRWVASPKAEKSKTAVGVVSVDARKIPPSSPFIGITMLNMMELDPAGEVTSTPKGIRITSIVDNSPADDADLWVNDLILQIDDAVTKDVVSLRKALGQYDVFDRVTITVLRGHKELEIKLTLASRDRASPDNQRTNMQNNMGSTPSSRRKDFPSCFQHDSMLTATTCGGPIVDLSGKVVGINIARGGRVSSLALPTEVVLPVITKLKTGKLAPEIVNKDRIKAIDLELDEIQKLLGDLPGKKIVLERKYNVERARSQELEKTMSDLQERIDAIKEKSKKYKVELDIVKKQLRNKAKTREQLELDRKQLVTGSR